MPNFFASVTLFFKDQFTAGAEKAKSGFTSMASAAASLGKDNGLLATSSQLAMVAGQTEPFRAKLSAALEGPSRLAAGLDSSFKNIQAVTGATASEMAGLQSDLIRLGGTSVAGLQSTANTFYDIAGGVTDAAVRMPTLQAAMALAEAGQADLGASAKGLVSVMNSYSYSADKAMFASDVFTQTVGKGVGSMDEFVAAMGPMAGLAASVGIGFDQLGTAEAYLTSKGKSAAQAATMIRASITALMNPNKEMGQALAALGLESGTAAIQQYGLAGALVQVQGALGGSKDAMAKALGSVEALQGATDLVQNDFIGFSEGFQNGLEGITASARTVQLESYEAKMARLQSAQDAFNSKVGMSSNRIKGFFADIKAAALGTGAAVMQSGFGDAFASVAAGAGLAGEKVLAVGGGALNVASQLAMLASAAKNAGGYMTLFKESAKLVTLPLQMVGSGMGKIVVGSGRFVAGLALQVASLFGYVPAAGSAAAANMTLAASTWAAVWPVLAIVAGVALLAGGAYLIVKNWKPISAFFLNLWTGISSAAKVAWEGITGFVSSAWEAIKRPFTAVGEFFAKVFGGAKASGAAAMTTFASGIASGSATVTSATDRAFVEPAKRFPHSDADIGPFSKLTSSGRSLMTTFAAGIESEPAVDAALAASFEGAAVYLSAPGAAPTKSGGGSGGRAGEAAKTYQIRIDNLTVQADEVRSVVDFVEMLMAAAGEAI
jgi:TP901 family phage tail tape measure protein